MTKLFSKTILLTLIFLISSFGILYSETKQTPPDFAKDAGYQAYKKASESNTFLMIYLTSDSKGPDIETAYTEAASKLSKELIQVRIDVNNPDASYLVTKYNLRYAPRPMVVIIAPNGAIVGSFQTPFTPAQVKNFFYSPKTHQCILAFQESKIVFISVQNNETSENKKALEGVNKFKAKNAFYGSSELIIIDPTDKSETQLLERLQVQTTTKKAMTFMMVPPGRILGSWSGATDPDEILKRLQSSMKSCAAPSCADPNCK